jgi:small subunit ribosomal protein S17
MASLFLGTQLSCAAPQRAAGGRAGCVTVAKQSMNGTVVSVAGAKSVVVNVQRQVAHPVYLKRVYLSKKYMVHDEDSRCKVGDVVRITQARAAAGRRAARGAAAACRWLERKELRPHDSALQCRPLSARKRFEVTDLVKAMLTVDAPLPNETAAV